LSPGHLDKGFRSVETHGLVPALLEREKIPTWPTTQVEDPHRRVASDRLEERVNVLRNVVIARPLEEGVRLILVVPQGAAADLR
jgi:hypothetical protein